MEMSQNKQRRIFQSQIPFEVWLWVSLPISVLIILWSMGMEPSGAAFYASLTLVIYQATNPDLCRLTVFEDHLRIDYFRFFKRTIVIPLDELDRVRFKRGELIRPLPFWKKIHLKDYLEFTPNNKEDISQSLSLNIVCPPNEARQAVALANQLIRKKYERPTKIA